MPVSARGNKWQAQVNFQGKRYRRDFDHKKEAQTWEAETKAALLKGEPIDLSPRAGGRTNASGMDTLSGLVEHVFNTHWIVQSGGSRQRLNALCIIKHIGLNTPVTKLTRADVDKARAALLKTDAPATVNRKVAALSKCLSIYADDHPNYVKPKLAKYKESEGRIRRFTPAEEQQALAFFSFIGQQDMCDYVILSLDTGLRQGELLAMRFIDYDGHKVTVWGRGQGEQRTKSGKSRSIPLTPRAKEIMDRRRETEPTEAEVFPNLYARQVSHYWQRFSEAIHMDEDPAFVPHILRHEFCSRLADRDINAAIIKELAGHSSLIVTQRYIHIRAESLMGAIAALGKTQPPVDHTK